MEKTRKGQKEGGMYENIAKYFLLTMVLSFLGWLFEVGVIFVLYRRWANTGFLTLPICPIYGVSLLVTYLLLGTPNEGRGILKNIENPIARGMWYLLFAFLIPTVAELLVGGFFDVFFDKMLWSYAALPMNIKGYISVPISLAWMTLIFLFMKYVFSSIKKLVFKLPKRIALPLAIGLAIAVFADFAFSYQAI